MRSSPRTIARLALCLLALAALPALAACGSSSSAGSASANAGASATPSGGASTTTTTPGRARFDRTALAACLKQQGVTLPPRPQGAVPGGPPPGGPPPANGTRPRGRGFGFFGRNLSPAQRQKLQAALQKCGARFGLQRFGQGRFAANTPRFRAALTKFVACVRQHGFALPAPNTSGKGPVFDPRKVDRNDPRFVAASRACQALLRPSG